MGKRIAKLSSLRFVVRVLNDPAWQKNYGSGKDVSSETSANATKGTIILLTGVDYPSAIQLPGSKTK